MTISLQEQARDAVDLIKTKGWRRGVGINRTELCLGAAIEETMPPEIDEMEFSERIRYFATRLSIDNETMAETVRWSGMLEIVRWNDSGNRTKEDALNLLDSIAEGE